MQRTLILILLQLLFVAIAIAQHKPDFFVGEWKSYMSDSTTFEYLRLDADGNGIKGVGKTINGKDTILANNFAFMQITDWEVINDQLIIESKHGFMFDTSGIYIIQNKSMYEKGFTLFGDHLQLGIYPSRQNFSKDTFKRPIRYVDSEAIRGDFGVRTAKCIVEMEIFTFEEMDSFFRKFHYIGFDDLIPHLVGCTREFNFVHKYPDPAYEILLPKDFDTWSFGYGNENFYISFRSRNDTITETSIDIYYDFIDSDKNYYFSKIEKGEEEKNLTSFQGKDLYLFKNWQKKFSGEIFYDNHICLAYYTRDKSKEEMLKQCIASFKYKNIPDKK